MLKLLEESLIRDAQLTAIFSTGPNKVMKIIYTHARTALSTSSSFFPLLIAFPK